MRTLVASMRVFCVVLFTVLLIAVHGCSREEVDPQAVRLSERMQDAYERGEWSKALALADSAEERAPQLADVPFTRGLILTKLKRFEEARAAYERALALDPTYRRAWYNLGHNAFLQRNYRKALAFYKKERTLVEDLDRDDQGRQGGQHSQVLPTIMAQIGRTYALMGVPDSAEAAYKDALSLDTSYAIAHAWLSELYESQGRLGPALSHAKKALEQNPAEVGHAYQVGFLLFQTGRIDEAALLLSAVVKQWPGHEGAAYNLGRALKALGREQEAEVMLDRVEEIQRLQEQALVAQRAVEMYPTDPRRWVNLAGLMMQIGYHDKAEEALTAAHALKPSELSLKHDLANLALVRGDTTLAINRFQALLREDSTFADAWLNLGIIYAMTGRHPEARMAWERVLQFNPDDPDAKSYLARLEQR